MFNIMETMGRTLQGKLKKNDRKIQRSCEKTPENGPPDIPISHEKSQDTTPAEKAAGLGGGNPEISLGE